MKIHIVRKGDNLWVIAKKYNISLEKLQKANPQIKDPYSLDIGTKILIPTGGMSMEPKYPRKPEPIPESPEIPEMEMPKMPHMPYQQPPYQMPREPMQGRMPYQMPHQMPMHQNIQIMPFYMYCIPIQPQDMPWQMPYSPFMNMPMRNPNFEWDEDYENGLVENNND